YWRKNMFKKVLVGLVCGMLALQSISCSSKKNEGEVSEVGLDHSIMTVEHEHGSQNDPHVGMGAVHGSKKDPHAGMDMGAMHGSKIDSGSPDDVVTTVNGEKIIRRDVDRMLDVYKQFVQPEMLPKVREQIIHGLVTQALLRNFISTQNIEVKQEEIDKELEDIKSHLKNNPSTANLSIEEVFESQGQTLESFKNKLKIQLSLEQLFEKDIDDAQLQDYFQKNIDSFSEDTVTASHILVDTRKLATPQELDEAKKKIEGIKKEIAEGKDFAEMAKQYSDCPSKEKGGDLGTFPRKGAMVESFAAAAFKLVVGEVSEPVKTDFGYHIIKATARKKGKEITFEEAKEKIKAGLKEQKAGKLIESLWEKATIENS
ncbi:MAG: peptidylprolyl isomerase, partial [Candidatus Brocadiales bacterium]